MNKQETIERLCALVSEVGDRVFNNHYPHDCFCGEYGSVFDNHEPVISIDVIRWIEDAVRERMIASGKINFVETIKPKG